MLPLTGKAIGQLAISLQRIWQVEHPMPLSDHANRWKCFVESGQRFFYDVEKRSSGCGPPANPCMDLVDSFSHCHKSLASILANLFGHNYGMQEMSDGWEDRQAFTGHAGKLVVLVVLGNSCRLEQTG